MSNDVVEKVAKIVKNHIDVYGKSMSQILQFDDAEEAQRNTDILNALPLPDFDNRKAVFTRDGNAVIIHTVGKNKCGQFEDGYCAVCGTLHIDVSAAKNEAERVRIRTEAYIRYANHLREKSESEKESDSDEPISAAVEGQTWGTGWLIEPSLRDG